MQGVFSSVWGLSSIIGPLLGGLFVDSLGWQWVFWINLVPGLFATTLVLLAWRELHPPRGGSVDVVGALLLAGGIVTLLLALGQMNAQQGFDVMRFAPLLGVSLILFALLLVVERRASNPILPLALFRQRLFASATGHGFLAGFALFGTISFLPLAVKAVLGVSATQAGATLTPLMLGWVSASVVSSWLLLRIPYRRLVIAGATALLVGATILVLSTSGTMSQTVLWICGALMGLGMGAAVSPFLITIQSTVGRQFLGAATATLQFSRTIGGTVGVGVMGMILAWRLAAGMDGLGMDPHTVALDALLDASTTASAATLIALREVLVNALQGVFLTALGAAVLAWVVCIFAPHIPVRVRQTVRSEPQIENVPAE
jgi:MFS family permease